MNWRAALVIPGAALLFLAAGGVSYLLGHETAEAVRRTSLILYTGLVLTGAVPVLTMLRGMLRGEFAADVVAVLAIVTAALLGQPFAGLVVVLMLTGGAALERFAEGKAGAAVSALEAAAPRQAHRVGTDGRVEDVSAEQVRVGDVLLVRPGELVPCDGEVVQGRSHVDASAITGEPLGVPVGVGSKLLSGSANVDGPLRLRATATAGESSYARIVTLVREAQASKAPLQRVADRVAVWFTPFTLAVCGITWLLSHDWTRVLSVLVVATPCPLILATPIAIIGGINRCARRQVIVRTGGALEALSRVTVAVFDKTGTLTHGQPAVATVTPVAGVTEAELLRLAASVDYASGHQLARPLVKHAEQVVGTLPEAEQVRETPGQGITGVVEGQVVRVGSLSWLLEASPAAADDLRTLAATSTGLRAFVATDTRALGMIGYADTMRTGLAAFFTRLRGLGVTRTLLMSGDHTANVATVARELGITEARGDLLPQDKVQVVAALRDAGAQVAMVGDGTNDAPALASATVGIALAGHGGGITAEAADVVLLVDDVSRVADAIEAGQRAMRIAKQSIGVGLALSVLGMAFAASGHLVPFVGALVQEGIDVAVILNALRASRPGRA